MINFPNQSRSFDEDAGIIRFSGYDGVMEVRFVLEAPALERLAGLTRTLETAYLDAFDRFRSKIEAVAVRAYQKKRNSMVRLSYDDF